MAWTLRLYRNITPNEGRNTHYVFTTALDYINELESARIGAILTLDNFRINANRAEINATSTLEEIFNEITYAIVYDADTKYFRAYWVTSSVNESGMIKLTLNVDLWASSIMGARFSDMHVTRCNRRIDNFMYFDEIKKIESIATSQGLLFARMGKDPINIDYFSVIFQLNFNVSANLFGDNQITRTALYSASVRTILNAISSVATNNYANVNALEKLADALGGVYKVAGGNKAQIVRTWIVPTSDFIVETSAQAPYNVVTKCHYSDLVDANFNVEPVAPKVINYTCDLASVLRSQYSHTTESARAWQATHALTIGGSTNGLKIKRGINSLALYRLVYSATDLRVLVTDGINDVDITQQFEFSVTGNNETQTTLTRTLNLLGGELRLINGVVGGAISGGNAGAFLGASRFLSGTLEQVKDARTLSPISTGDASTNLYVSDDRPAYFYSPYRVYYINSANDEIENALQYGAMVDTFVNDLGVAPTRELLLPTSWTFNGVSKTFDRADETFIAIDDMTLDGVQENAKDYIKNEFGRGIFYKSI